MYKYEVRTVDVETRDGNGPMRKFFDSTNQESTLVKSFYTLKEAREFYATLPVSVRYMGTYYLHRCKFIECTEYDEEGWFIGSDGWFSADFPNVTSSEDLDL